MAPFSHFPSVWQSRHPRRGAWASQAQTGRRVNGLVLGAAAWLWLAVTSAGLEYYEFGDPSGEEQLYVEMINRARAAPAAEGIRLAASNDPEILAAYNYFNVNLSMMKNEFALIGAQAPLAPNASLTNAARSHSAWMLANATQSHYQSNPYNDPFTRMLAAGFTYTSAGENVYASAKSVAYGHAGFNVDWGYGSGGMQDGRGHRGVIHSASYREIGVGVVNGSNGSTGPQLVTQDFATSVASATFATGVAYYDLNANAFYDVGEGIAGLTVNASDATSFCTTASGGGWVLPVPATPATRSVTFSGLNVNHTAALVFPGSQNAKLDLKLTYAPPAITSSSSAAADSPHLLSFAAVGGATAYQWNRWTSSAALAENCENTSQITTSITGGYSVLSTIMRQQGAASFHLQNFTANSQSILLSPLYYGQGGASLTFQSRVRYATTSEKFKVQVKEEGSLVWQDVFSQTGNNTAGESAFFLRGASLAGMVGKAFRIRLLLDYSGGGYYGTSGDQVGWFIDAINFTGVSTLGNNVSQTLTGTSGSFTPALGSYLMSVTPVISGRHFPASYQTLSVTTAVPPAITCQPTDATINIGLPAVFTVGATGTSPTFQWYEGESGNTSTPVAGATQSSHITPPLTATTCVWVRVANAVGSADSITATATVQSSFTAWAANLELANGLAAGTLANHPLADFDHDGRSNLIEYAFGASPLLAHDPAPRLPVAHITASHLVLHYQRDTALADLIFTAEACTSLAAWHAPGDPDAPAGFTDELLSTTNGVESREVKIPLLSGTRLLRLRVTQP